MMNTWTLQMGYPLITLERDDTTSTGWWVTPDIIITFATTIFNNVTLNHNTVTMIVIPGA